MLSISKAFDVGRSVIANHRDKCVPEALARGRLAVQAESGGKMIDQGSMLYRECVAVIERAKERQADILEFAHLPKDVRKQAVLAAKALSRNDMMVLRAVRAAQPALELMARLSGDIDDRTVVIHADPDFIALRDCIIGALADFPEAGLAVVDAIQTFEQMREPDAGRPG